VLAKTHTARRSQHAEESDNEQRVLVHRLNSRFNLSSICYSEGKVLFHSLPFENHSGRNAIGASFSLWPLTRSPGFKSNLKVANLYLAFMPPFNELDLDRKTSYCLQANLLLRI